MKIGEVLYVVTHPGLAARTYEARLLDRDDTLSSWRFSDAMRQVQQTDMAKRTEQNTGDRRRRLSHRNRRSPIQWSEHDLDRMAQGELPRHRPHHNY